MKKHMLKKMIASVLLSGALLVSAAPVYAVNLGQADLKATTGPQAGFSGDGSLLSTIGRLLNGILSALGALLLVLILYSGFLWMTAAGDSKQVQKARDILGSALIGLLICLMAYGISNFVVKLLGNADLTADSGGGGDE